MELKILDEAPSWTLISLRLPSWVFVLSAQPKVSFGCNDKLTIRRLFGK